MHGLRCRGRRCVLSKTPAREPRVRPRVLLVAVTGSYRLAAYIDAAVDAGIDVTLASEGEHSLIGAVRGGVRIDLRDADASLAAIVAAGPFDAVLAAEDAGVELAARASRRFGRPSNQPGAARRARRKDLGRQALRDAGLAVPAFAVLDLDTPLTSQAFAVDYPCVIKPLAMSGSRGVIRCNDAASLQAAAEVVRAITALLPDPFERRHALLEAYMPGVEVAVEGILVAGELEVVAVFDKPDPLHGPYFEESLYVTPSRLPGAARAAAQRCVADACAAYGLRHGPIHAEVRIDGDRALLVEVAARTIGGDCARLLSYTTGMTLEAMVLARALGRSLAAAAGAEAAGVLMLPTPRAGVLRRIEGVRAASAVPGIEDVVIAVREGYELVPLPHGGSYLGFVFARAETPAAVEAALREAGKLLEVVTSPSLPVAVAS